MICGFYYCRKAFQTSRQEEAAKKVRNARGRRVKVPRFVTGEGGKRMQQVSVIKNIV